MPVELVMIAGARPNFMKIAPLWNALSQDSKFAVTLVHTGQHFDDSMSGQFFRDLGLPEPTYHLGAGGGSHAHQTAEIMKRLEPVLLERSPRGVIVVGDVNSTVAGALVAKKLGIDVVHAEGGLRSFDRTLSEILEALSVISEDLPLFWPVHPRARARLERGSVDLPPRIHLLDPLGYLDFLRLQAESFTVLTDSGGIQEETTALGVPCLTLRENTERPVTIECGTNRLAGTTKDSILQAWNAARLVPPKGVLPPLWDGKAGERCHAVLSSYFQNNET